MKRIRKNVSQQVNDVEQVTSGHGRQNGLNGIQRAVEAPTSDTLSPDAILDLQQLHGNQFVSGLTSNNGLTLQPKLEVTPADDKYEQEADAIAADAVSRMHDTDIQREEMPEEEEALQMKRDNSVQRDMEEEELMMKRDNSIQRDMEEEELQMKADTSLHDGGIVSDDIEQAINSERGGGSPLPSDLGEQLGSSMGADFSNVRVHTGDKADQLSQSIQSKAFTTQNDIFFKNGEYDPNSANGQELLAHELAHTIQQGATKQSKK